MVIVVIIVMILLTVFTTITTYLHFTRFKLKFPFKDTMEKVGLPIVAFEQKGKPIYFLIDSGADNSVLNTSALAKLDYIELEGGRNVYGIDGNQVQTSFVGVKFFSQNHSFVETFQVFDVAGLDNVNNEMLMLPTGTHFSYYHICHRKLWLFANGINIKLMLQNNSSNLHVRSHLYTIF